MKVRVQIPLEHPIVFFHDAYVEPEIPNDAGDALVTSTRSCIAVQVTSWVEGDIDVTVSDEAPHGTALPLFSGSIETPKRFIGMTDSYANFYFMLPLKSDVAQVDVWECEGEDPFARWIRICELDLYQLPNDSNEIVES